MLHTPLWNQVSCCDGLNEIFASLVPSLDHLMCEVVNVEAPYQTVNLYDVNKQNIAKVVLGTYNILIPQVKALSPAPPPIPNIKARFWLLFKCFIFIFF